ncbi:hypothetical protein [Legionella brunensis]|uniref:Uncharacterized protein n=1 Tax=Legionella brunensis TaxID=29422 RepID=A0A0W0SSP8_9GAMM|nr:hypothetical protein [Legionella brunensis]KTC86442.1 hypothetical protein Lbru_0383 [Legionella brunensis]
MYHNKKSGHPSNYSYPGTIFGPGNNIPPQVVTHGHPGTTAHVHHHSHGSQMPHHGHNNLMPADHHHEHDSGGYHHSHGFSYK